MANNPENIIPNSERTAEERKAIARAGGIASGKARRERATIADAVRKVLDEVLADGTTRRDAFVAKCLKNTFDNGDVRDLKTLSEILGELKQQVSVDGGAIVINVADEKQKKDVTDIINRPQ